MLRYDVVKSIKLENLVNMYFMSDKTKLASSIVLIFKGSYMYNKRVGFMLDFQLTLLNKFQSLKNISVKNVYIKFINAKLDGAVVIRIK